MHTSLSSLNSDLHSPLGQGIHRMGIVLRRLVRLVDTLQAYVTPAQVGSPHPEPLHEPETKPEPEPQPQLQPDLEPEPWRMSSTFIVLFTILATLGVVAVTAVLVAFKKRKHGRRAVDAEAEVKDAEVTVPSASVRLIQNDDAHIMRTRTHTRTRTGAGTLDSESRRGALCDEPPQLPEVYDGITIEHDEDIFELPMPPVTAPGPRKSQRLSGQSLSKIPRVQ